MRLIIKNMVCPRCIAAVKRLLQKHELDATNLRLGEVELKNDASKETLASFGADLLSEGFELLDEKKSKLIEKVKSLLIKKVQSGEVEERFSITKYITGRIFKDYSTVSKLFSEVEGITVEQFFILQKIEKTKEWLIYDEHSLGDIAFKLGYSSTQHLSTQFKKVTGMTPSEFKKLGALHRKPIDGVQQ